MLLPKKRNGYLTPPVIIVLALITLAVAATLLFQAKFFSVGKNPSPIPTALESTQPTAKQTTEPAPRITYFSGKDKADVDLDCGEISNEYFYIKCPNNWKLQYFYDRTKESLEQYKTPLIIVNLNGPENLKIGIYKVLEGDMNYENPIYIKNYPVFINGTAKKSTEVLFEMLNGNKKLQQWLLFHVDQSTHFAFEARKEGSSPTDQQKQEILDILKSFKWK